MGNFSTKYSSSIDDQVRTIPDEWLWFTIKLTSQSTCADGKTRTGYLSYRFDDPDTTGTDTREPCCPRPVLDTHTFKEIRENAPANPKLMSGFCWRVVKDGSKYRLAVRDPETGKPIPIINLYYSSIWLAPTVRNRGTTGDVSIDINKSLANQSLWFFNNNDMIMVKNASDTLSAFIDGNRPLPHIRFCGQDRTSVDFSVIILGNTGIDKFTGDPLYMEGKTPLEVFLSPENYVDFFWRRYARMYWKNPDQIKKTYPGMEAHLYSYALSLPPAERSKFIASTGRCNYSDGNAFWNDPICRTFCNGENPGSDMVVNTKYCAPFIANKVVQVANPNPALPPNGYISSPLGRYFCENNPGKCTAALTTWCSTESDSGSNKMASYGKSAMCACSWPENIKKEKILRGNEGLRQLFNSDSAAVRDIAQRILNAQLDFVCQDENCKLNPVYLTENDKTRRCPDNQVQICNTSLIIDNKGTVSVGNLGVATKCSQEYQQIFQNSQYSTCLSQGKNLVKSDVSDSYICCDPSSISIGGQCAKPCLQDEERVDGKCLKKCQSGKRAADKSCIPECKKGEEYKNGSCQSICHPGEEYKTLPDGKSGCVIPIVPLAPEDSFSIFGTHVKKTLVYVLSAIAIALVIFFVANRRSTAL